MHASSNETQFIFSTIQPTLAKASNESAFFFFFFWFCISYVWFGAHKFVIYTVPIVISPDTMNCSPNQPSKFRSENFWIVSFHTVRFRHFIIIFRFGLSLSEKKKNFFLVKLSHDRVNKVIKLHIKCYLQIKRITVENIVNIQHEVIMKWVREKSASFLRRKTFLNYLILFSKIK